MTSSFSKRPAVLWPLSLSPHSRAAHPSGLRGWLEVHRVAEIFPILHHLDSLFRLLPEDPCPHALPLRLLILRDCRAQYFQTSVIG